MTSCSFCGTLIPNIGLKRVGRRYAINKRCKSLSCLKLFVTTKCKPTPFLYNYFANCNEEGFATLCLPCVNWQRRSCIGARKRNSGSKPYLLPDHFAVFMMEPGSVPFPDQRCMLRLVTALKRASSDWDGPAGLMLRLMPLPVQVMVSMLPVDIETVALQESPYPTNIPLLNLLVGTWWDYNGRSVFFAHKVTAKLVRRMIKDRELVNN